MGINTCDLEIDLIVKPDYTRSWKDEADCHEGIQLGLISLRSSNTSKRKKEYPTEQVPGTDW